MSSLDADMIAKLLKEDQEKPKRGGAKADLTKERTLQNWYQLPHHFCLSGCEHREQQPVPTHRACWNPECLDPRDPGDRGTQVVAFIKQHAVCRYCFLGGYMSD